MVSGVFGKYQNLRDRSDYLARKERMGQSRDREISPTFLSMTVEPGERRNQKPSGGALYGRDWRDMKNSHYPSGGVG